MKAAPCLSCLLSILSVCLLLPDQSLKSSKDTGKWKLIFGKERWEAGIEGFHKNDTKIQDIKPWRHFFKFWIFALKASTGQTLLLDKSWSFVSQSLQDIGFQIYLWFPFLLRDKSAFSNLLSIYIYIYKISPMKYNFVIGRKKSVWAGLSFGRSVVRSVGTSLPIRALFISKCLSFVMTTTLIYV